MADHEHLLDGHQDIARRDSRALFDVDLFYSAALVGQYVLFHLHGLKDCHSISFCHSVALLDLVADDNALHGHSQPVLGHLGLCLLDCHACRSHLHQIGFSIDLDIEGHGFGIER